MYKEISSHRSSISSFKSYIEDLPELTSSGLHIPRTPSYFFDARYILPKEVTLHFPVPRKISSCTFKDDIPFRDTSTGETLFTFYGQSWTLWDNKANTLVAKFKQGGGYLQFEDHYNIFVGNPRLEKLCRLTVESGMRKCKISTLPSFVNEIVLERKWDGSERSICYLGSPRGQCLPVASLDNRRVGGNMGSSGELKDKVITVAPNVDIAFVVAMCLSMALHFDQNLDFKLVNATV